MPHYLGIRALLYHADQFAKAGVEEAASDLGRPGSGQAEAEGARYSRFWLLRRKCAPASGGDRLLLAERPGHRRTGGRGRRSAIRGRTTPDELARATEVFQFYYDLMHTHGIVPQEAASWGYTELDTNLAQNHSQRGRRSLDGQLRRTIRRAWPTSLSPRFLTSALRHYLPRGGIPGDVRGLTTPRGSLGVPQVHRRAHKPVDAGLHQSLGP